MRSVHQARPSAIQAPPSAGTASAPRHRAGAPPSSPRSRPDSSPPWEAPPGRALPPAFRPLAPPARLSRSLLIPVRLPPFHPKTPPTLSINPALDQFEARRFGIYLFFYFCFRLSNFLYN